MLNERIHSSRRSVTQIVGAVKDDSFFVDNSFQRRLVWTERQKIRLIETILMGYPMPEIYLWKQQPDPQTGAQKFSIVDGQQRVNAIWSFVDGEYSLKKSALDGENKDRSFAGKSWVELEPALKSQIWSYEINTRSFPDDVSKTEIKTVFVRLNETDRSLNPQEMRNARFHGEFLRAAEEVANHPIWVEKKIFSTNDLRRMKDVEFASTLLNFLRNGITTDTPSTLNDSYEAFADKYEKRSTDVNQSKRILDKLVNLIDDAIAAKSYIVRETHLYTLFVVLFQLERKKRALDIAKVDGFFTLYKQLSDDPEGFQNAEYGSLLRSYLQGSSSRIRSKSSREQRIFSFLDYLDK